MRLAAWMFVGLGLLVTATAAWAAPPPPAVPRVVVDLEATVRAIRAEREHCLALADASQECQLADDFQEMIVPCGLARQACMDTALQRLAAAGVGVPTVTSTVPTTMAAGSRVTLRGTNLRVSRTPLLVIFEGLEGVDYQRRQVTVQAMPSATELAFTVPVDAPSGQIRINTAWGTLLVQPVEITYPPIANPPAWSFVSPDPATVECPVVFSGGGFAPGDQIGRVTGRGQPVRFDPVAGAYETVFTNVSGPQTVEATILRRGAGGAISSARVSATVVVQHQGYFRASTSYGDGVLGGTVSFETTGVVEDVCGLVDNLTWTMTIPGPLIEVGQRPIGVFNPGASRGRPDCFVSRPDRRQITCRLPSTLPNIPINGVLVPPDAIQIWMGRGHGGYYVRLPRP